MTIPLPATSEGSKVCVMAAPEFESWSEWVFGEAQVELDRLGFAKEVRFRRVHESVHSGIIRPFFRSLPKAEQCVASFFGLSQTMLRHR